MIPEKDTVSLVQDSVKNAQPESNNEGTSDKPKIRNILFLKGEHGGYGLPKCKCYKRQRKAK